MVLFNVFSPSSEPPPPANAPITVKTAGVDVRLGFLRKVYSLLTVNFLITIGISCAFAFVTPIKDYVVDNSWPIYASIAVSLAILLVLLCVPLKFPVNLLVMYVFVFAYSSMVGVIVARYYDRGWGSVVLMAFFATLAIFLSITAYIMVTKKDFSFLHGFLFAGLIALFVVSLLAYLISWPSQNNKINRTLRFIISVGGYVFQLSIEHVPC